MVDVPAVPPQPEPGRRASFHWREAHVKLLWAAVAGVVGALSSAAFRALIRLAQWLLAGEGSGFVHVALTLPAWARVVVPTVGGLLAGLVLQHGPRLVSGSTPDYMEAIALGDGVIRARPALVRSLASFASIASGASIGREGAMVQLAAVWASVLGRLMRFSMPRLRLMVACGAAAGVASAYNTPVAASLFVAEIVFGSIAMETLGALLVASVLASFVMRVGFGAKPIFEVPPVSMTSAWELLLFIALGVVTGFAGPGFLLLLRQARRLLNRVTTHPWLRMTLGGLLVGLISVKVPYVWGNGYSVVSGMLHERWLFGAVLLVLVAKLAATASVVGAGAVGGVFTPTLFTGASLGMLVGIPLHALWPQVVGVPQAYAIVGMGAFLAATTHAPLTAILMIFEMTLDYAMAVPLMLACVAAYFTATAVYPESIYSHSLRPRADEAGPEQPRQATAKTGS